MGESLAERTLDANAATDAPGCWGGSASLWVLLASSTVSVSPSAMPTTRPVRMSAWAAVASRSSTRGVRSWLKFLLVVEGLSPWLTCRSAHSTTSWRTC